MHNPVDIHFGFPSGILCVEPLNSLGDRKERLSEELRHNN